MLHFSSDFYVISFIVTFSTLPYSDSGDANYDIKLQRWACDNLSIKKTNLSLLILSKPKIFFTFASVFIRFFKKYEQIGSFRFEIYSVQNISFICFVFCLGSEKNDSFRLGFMNKILFSLYNHFYSSFDQNVYIF